jgi:hypothetical protein
MYGKGVCFGRNGIAIPMTRVELVPPVQLPLAIFKQVPSEETRSALLGTVAFELARTTQPIDAVLHQQVTGTTSQDRDPGRIVVLGSGKSDRAAQQRLDVSPTVNVSIDVHPTVSVQDFVPGDVRFLGRRRRGVEQFTIRDPSQVLVMMFAQLPFRMESAPRILVRPEMGRHFAADPYLVQNLWNCHVGIR